MGYAEKGIIRLTDADKGVDFTKVIQGHVSQQVTQLFAIERTRPLVAAALRLECLEYILKDQFGNLYVCFTAHLMDGELYAVWAWVGVEKWDQTKKVIKLAKEWAKFRNFSDELLANLQSMAFYAFGKANLAVLKGAQAGKKMLDVPTLAELGAGPN